MVNILKSKVTWAGFNDWIFIDDYYRAAARHVVRSEGSCLRLCRQSDMIKYHCLHGIDTCYRPF